SRRDPLERSMSSDTRATTVVNQPPRFSISLVSDRLSLSHASCTASSASPLDPSMRYATARRWPRWASNCCPSQSASAIAHLPELALDVGKERLREPVDLCRVQLDPIADADLQDRLLGNDLDHIVATQDAVAAHQRLGE